MICNIGCLRPFFCMEFSFVYLEQCYFLLTHHIFLYHIHMTKNIRYSIGKILSLECSQAGSKEGTVSLQSMIYFFLLGCWDFVKDLVQISGTSIKQPFASRVKCEQRGPMKFSTAAPLLSFQRLPSYSLLLVSAPTLLPATLLLLHTISCSSPQGPKCQVANMTN